MIDRVQYCLNEWADNPLVFKQKPPCWLNLAIKIGDITPIFKTEDYWYLQVKTNQGVQLVAPDDWIIHNNGKLLIEKA